MIKARCKLCVCLVSVSSTVFHAILAAAKLSFAVISCSTTIKTQGLVLYRCSVTYCRLLSYTEGACLCGKYKFVYFKVCRFAQGNVLRYSLDLYGIAKPYLSPGLAHSYVHCLAHDVDSFSLTFASML